MFYKRVLLFCISFKLTGKTLGFPHIILYHLGFVVCFQNCTGHITMGSFLSGETITLSWSRLCTANCQPSVSKLPTFPHKVWGLKCLPQRVTRSLAQKHIRPNILHTNKFCFETLYNNKSDLRFKVFDFQLAFYFRKPLRIL